MFARALLAALALSQILPLTVPFNKPRHVEQARAPIERMGPIWAETCKDWDDWNKPAPPVRIHGNTYYVGTCGITAILIVGEQGDILIDSGPEESAGAVRENIARLGFNVRDIRYILFTHEHFDHVGGLAEFQRNSSSTLLSSARAARVIASGTPASDDPQYGTIQGFPAARVDGLVSDGQQIILRDIMVEAISTPGHTPGAMSWRWVSCDGGVCRTIVYADSLSPVSNDSYRFTDHPDVVAAFRKSIAKIAASPCDIVLSPHPSASGMRDRFAAGKPLLDPDGCKDYAAKLSANLDARLAKEATAK